MTSNTPTTTDDASTLTNLATRVAELEDTIAELAVEEGLVSTKPRGLSRRDVLHLGGLLTAGGIIGFALTEHGWETVRADGPDPNELEGTIYVSTIEADQLNTNVQVENETRTSITVEEWLALEGPVTQQEDGPRSVDGNVNIDVSETDLFNFETTALTDFDLAGDGHGLAAQTITVIVHSDGSDVLWPTEFDWVDDEPELANGDVLEVNARRVVYPDASVTWHAVHQHLAEGS